jgi:hypothetical protein
MIATMTPLTTCPLCACQLHDGVCQVCDYATPVAPPARPSLASLFAAAQDHEDALHDMWTDDLFLVTLERDFPTVWHSDEITKSQVLDRQWHFVYDGLTFAVTWKRWPDEHWTFQAWDECEHLDTDTSDGYLSALDIVLLAFMGNAVTAAELAATKRASEAEQCGGAAESEVA